MMDLPVQVEKGIEKFLDAARTAFGANLASVVLYGSGAEGRLRATSDVNVIAVVDSVTEAQMTAIGPVVAMLGAAIQLKVMFLRRTEVADAVIAFPVKFADIRRRRRVLFGEDVFTGITIPRSALVTRLRQVLLNLILRTRESYAERVGREELLVALVADMAGPLRSAAAALLDLENTPAASAKEALERVAAPRKAVAELSEAREKRLLPPGESAAAVFSLLEVAEEMLARLSRIAS
jgi:predicted nucleotidyltransferase